MRQLHFLTIVFVLVDCRRFSYHEYSAIEQTVLDLQREYPELIQVDTAQELYDIPAAGQCGKDTCKQYVVKLTNSTSNSTPQVFFSGALHGNERIGPTSTVEFIKLIVSNLENTWINYLLNNRVILIMPSPNSLGYYQNRRTENKVDPNRDFPFDLPQNSPKCMQTIAARSINEVFRNNLIQLSITFHAGMKAVSYEWGDETHKANFKSPDEYAMSDIGAGLAKFGRYPHKPMDELVYPVRGGMEDWAYAGSWAPNKNTCNPDTYGGYLMNKTIYTSHMLRIVNILVETSDNKTPREEDLGKLEDVMDFSVVKEGNFVMNAVRMMLFMTDIVQPYVHILNVKFMNEEVLVEYDVGGGVTVDSTYCVVFDTEVMLQQSPIANGVTHWGMVTQENRVLHPFSSRFTANINVQGMSLPDMISVSCYVVLDQSWGRPFDVMLPEAHISQLRTNESWQVENNGFIASGKILWESIPRDLSTVGVVSSTEKIDTADSEFVSFANRGMEIFVVLGLFTLILSMMKFCNTGSDYSLLN